MMNDKEIVLVIGGKLFTIADLGPAADMSIVEGMQNIIDNGLLGVEHIGKLWYEVILPDSITLEGAPDPEETLSYSLYQKYRVALKEYQTISAAGLCTKEIRQYAMELRLDWMAAKKLSSLDSL